MNLREAAQQALEALSVLKPDNWEDKELQIQAWEALRAALSEEAMQRLTDVQQEMEPAITRTERGLILHVGWDDIPAGAKLYLYPPKREWVGLTDEDMKEIFIYAGDTAKRVARAIEAKLKEKNT